MTNEFSVYASLLSAEPTETDSIAEWLADREAEKEMMNTKDIVETVQDNERLAAASGPFDGNVAVSQIRILSKQFTEEPDVIPYVAVLEEWEKGMWLIVPFSQYKVPATPGEMETGLKLKGLKVIQAWNGRTVQDSLMRKSYLFAELPEQVRQDALSLFRNQFAGTPLPEDFTAKRGGAIELDDDPRREYLAESVARLRPLAEAVIAEAEKPKIKVRPPIRINWRNPVIKMPAVTVYPLAAATITKRISKNCKINVANEELTVLISYQPEDRMLELRVFGTDGNVSTRLDGWSVIAGKETPVVLGTIDRGRFHASCAETFDGYVAIAHGEEEVIALE